ncbi:PAQR family membrane homeostasis protein TrhA [Kaarinaea lacus]
MTVVPITGFSDPFSSITHLFSAPIFLIIGVFLLRKFSGDSSRTITLSIFIFGVVFLLSMSGVFHLLTPSTDGRYVLRILDHAAIFILIAATFTPTHVLLFKGFMRWGVLLLVWGTAITGITLKSIYFTEVPEVVSLSLYLGLGWLGALTGYSLYRRDGLKTIAPLLYGAAAYTLGASLEFLRAPILISGVIGPHEIFHLLVIAGISFHWQFVYRAARIHKYSLAN